MKDILSDIRQAKTTIKELLEVQDRLFRQLNSLTGDLVELPGYEPLQDEIDDVLGCTGPDYDFINENLEAMENIVLAGMVREEEHDG